MTVSHILVDVRSMILERCHGIIYRLSVTPVRHSRFSVLFSSKRKMKGWYQSVLRASIVPLVSIGPTPARPGPARPDRSSPGHPCDVRNHADADSVHPVAQLRSSAARNEANRDAWSRNPWRRRRPPACARQRRMFSNYRVRQNAVLPVVVLERCRVFIVVKRLNSISSITTSANRKKYCTFSA